MKTELIIAIVASPISIMIGWGLNEISRHNSRKDDKRNELAIAKRNSEIKLLLEAGEKVSGLVLLVMSQVSWCERVQISTHSENKGESPIFSSVYCAERVVEVSREIKEKINFTHEIILMRLDFLDLSVVTDNLTEIDDILQEVGFGIHTGFMTFDFQLYSKRLNELVKKIDVALLEKYKSLWGE